MVNLLLLRFLLTFAQTSEAERLVIDFYSWYTSGGYRVMKPEFKALENGMTDMDFDGFDEAHRRFHFSEQLIRQSKELYRGCQTNLSSIPYREFQTFQDLDQYESIGCSFQFWQWFGTGMEHYEQYTLISSGKLAANKYLITVGFSVKKADPVSLIIPVTVELIHSQWTIVNIEVDWNAN